jgi:GATA-binding protein
VSGSPELTPTRKDTADDNPVTKIWKLYSHHQASLPNAQRMENITWRMMTMRLRKEKEASSADSTTIDTPSPSTDASVKTEPGLDQRVPDERGRRIDKGKAKVQVVGFDGLSQDGVDDDEYAPSFFTYCFCHLPPLAQQRHPHGLARNEQVPLTHHGLGPRQPLPLPPRRAL